MTSSMWFGRGAHRRWLRLAILVGVGAGIAAVAAAAAAGWSRNSSLESWLVMTSCLTGAGVLAWGARPGNRTGPLMTIAGLLCLLETLTFFSHSWSWLTAGLPTAALPFAPLAHMMLAFPRGRLQTRELRRTAATVYVFCFAVWPVAKTVLATTGSWSGGCPSRDLLCIHGIAGIREAASIAVLAGDVVLPAWIVYLLANRWRRGTGPARRVMAPVVVTGAIGAAATVIGQVLVPQGGAGGTAGFAIQGAGVSLIPLGFLVGLLRTRVTRTSLGELVVGLGAPGSSEHLREHLARALGDETLQVGFWVPALAGYVDAEGRPFALPDGDPARAVTTVRGDGGPLAALVHDPALLDDEGLVDAVVAAARIALENERLAAEVRAQVQEVRASRVRLVNAADAQRRRIERELQVGAQQRLASMVLALRMLSDRLDGRANPAAVEMIDRARDEARGALEDLRELARGLHPQVLTQEGLGAALELLCERSPVPVRLLGVRVGRLPEPVEAAAYFVCSEALTNVAKYAQATNVSVDLQVAGGRLEIEVVDDGVGGAHRDAGSGLRGLADRLDALGGRLNVRSPAGRGTQVRAWIPTADRTAEIAVEPPPLAVGARS